VIQPQLLLSILWLLPLIAAAPAAAQTPLPPRNVPNIGFERPDWRQIAPPDQTSVRTRRAASFLALIPGCLLFVLHLYRRRPYLLAWTTAWVLLALMLYLTTIGADLMRAGQESAGGRVVGLARGLGMGGALLSCLAIQSFRRQWRVPPWLITSFVASVLLFIVLAEAVGLAAALVIIYASLGVVYVVGGVLYVRVVRRVRMAGPVVIGVGMLGVASTYFYALALVAGGVAAIEPPNPTVFVSVAWHGLIALGMHLMVFEDMSAELQAINRDLAQTQLELQAAAVTDPLTGCYNRRFFDEVVERELERQRRHGVPLSMVFIDCDNLKAVNDALGHSIGDEVLRLIAEGIRVHVRRSDYVFRWGGDEFLVLMSCDEDRARTKAAEIQTAFASHQLTRQLPPGTGLSAGCVVVPPNTRDLLPLIREVDARMYANKRRGV
jgi:diguanylate cyclase (GGDEF)-like protein